MINNFISMIKNTFYNLDKTALHILKLGLKFCFILCIISIFVLLSYHFISLNLILFEIGLSLFKFSLIFAIEFIMCAIAADKIKKQLI